MQCPFEPCLHPLLFGSSPSVSNRWQHVRRQSILDRIVLDRQGNVGRQRRVRGPSLHAHHAFQRSLPRLNASAPLGVKLEAPLAHQCLLPRSEAAQDALVCPQTPPRPPRAPRVDATVLFQALCRVYCGSDVARLTGDDPVHIVAHVAT